MYQKRFKTYRKVRFHIDKLVYNLSAAKIRIEELKQKHNNKPLLIVGNGPSINSTPLDKFKSASIGMNKIDLLFDKTSWRPDYIFCVNGLVMHQYKTNFMNSRIPIFLDVKAKYMNINGPNISYFINNPNIDFISSYDNGFASGATVTFFALQFAYLVKANPIIIVGVDHSFNLSNDKASKIEKRSDEIDQNHFDPNYFQKGSYWGIPDLVNSELNYSVAKNALNNQGVKVYDATINGKLNIFPKIDIEKALKIVNNAG